MSKAQSIRGMRREGETIAAISQKLGVSRDTACRYLDKDDFSPKPPAPAGGASIMDRHCRIIEGYLEKDSRNWRKQRRTGGKIYERLRGERVDRRALRDESQVRARRAEIPIPHSDMVSQRGPG